jgi:hypothetical protein
MIPPGCIAGASARRDRVSFVSLSRLQARHTKRMRGADGARVKPARPTMADSNQGTAMSSQALHRVAPFGHKPSAVAPSTVSWLQRLLSGARAALARRCEQRRARLAYRRDLVALAALGERELADFGAPAWLVADVQRYRQLPPTHGLMS